MMTRGVRIRDREERLFIASQWQLMWRKFKKSHLAVVGITVLVLFYLGAAFCEFLTPYAPDEQRVDLRLSPPQRLHLYAEDGFHLRPFVYGRSMSKHPKTLQRMYTENREEQHGIQFFVRGDPYKLWGALRSDLHLFGVEDGTIFLLGTDNLGRDVFSRILYASRISLTIGLVGVALSFVLGCILGGASGYFGGKIDMIVQRVTEVLLSVPSIPLWMLLSSVLPPRWSAIKVYFGITVILSLKGWTGLARVVRGKFLQLREEDYVMAAKIAGAKQSRIISGHLLPSFMSYLIVHITLAIPGMILGETALSFLGIGLRPPVVSWGTLLQQAQDFPVIVLYPWLLIPGLFVVVAVLAFNFVGDGLRDAADPYK